MQFKKFPRILGTLLGVAVLGASANPFAFGQDEDEGEVEASAEVQEAPAAAAAEAPASAPAPKAKKKVKKAKAEEPEAAADAPAPAEPQAPQGDLMVVDYEYVDAAKNPEKSFKMQVPSDWNVQKDYSGYSIFMDPKVKLQPSAQNPVVADPNISVIVRNTPQFIDEEQLETYSKEIEKNLKESLGSASLNLFAKNILNDLPGGKKGLLYYLTYKRGEYDIKTAILVMSNETVMYRVSLTDYQVTFDKNLERYFPVMASIEIKGNPPTRESPYAPMIPWAGGAVGVIVMFGALSAFNGARQRKLLNEVSGDDGYGYASGSADANGSVPPRKASKGKPSKQRYEPEEDEDSGFASEAPSSAYGSSDSDMSEAPRPQKKAPPPQKKRVVEDDEDSESGFESSGPSSVASLKNARAKKKGHAPADDEDEMPTFRSSAPESEMMAPPPQAKGKKPVPQPKTPPQKRQEEEVPQSKAVGSGYSGPEWPED